MPSQTLRQVQGVIAIGIVAILATACSQSTSAPKPKPTPTVKSLSQPLPAVVNGVPLLDLAKHALGAAEAYSVTKPVNVQVVVTTQATLYAQVPAAGGGTGPEYVVMLRGRFTCGSCGRATPISTTTTDPSSVEVSTMVLQLPIPLTSGATTGVAVGVGTPDMAELGTVYNLDPYIRSLAGVSVPIGPLPS
jgi:hypothetical protein